MKLAQLTATDGKTKFWVNPSFVVAVGVSQTTGKTELLFHPPDSDEPSNGLLVSESPKDAVDAINQAMS
jgi:hypothetical protein